MSVYFMTPFAKFMISSEHVPTHVNVVLLILAMHPCANTSQKRDFAVNSKCEKKPSCVCEHHDLSTVWLEANIMIRVYDSTCHAHEHPLCDLIHCHFWSELLASKLNQAKNMTDCTCVIDQMFRPTVRVSSQNNRKRSGTQTGSHP